MSDKLRVGILGGTGMVGQRFIALLENHPWFVGVQFHPEYKSTVANPHPLFVSFVKAVKKVKSNKLQEKV